PTINISAGFFEAFYERVRLSLITFDNQFRYMVFVLFQNLVGSITTLVIDDYVFVVRIFLVDNG
ncbi:MAG: hypothetical protein VX855_04180, partial [Verrucomicrobiota bacterium]|nr:hypothetical protein [Verrucomicrobiota bacterium]